ncbi:MAG: hypothetical protein EBT13_18020 [Rhodobacteraceae bacterium]|nr:hypothetical protein [Paracoccaceae bacterium]
MRKSTDGRQAIIQGAERITDKEQAQRLADRRLTPKVEQKPPSGLFSDQASQIDLVDFMRRTK